MEFILAPQKTSQHLLDPLTPLYFCLRYITKMLLINLMNSGIQLLRLSEEGKLGKRAEMHNVSPVKAAFNSL